MTPSIQAPSLPRSTGPGPLSQQFRSSGIVVLDDAFPRSMASELQAQGSELDRLRAERGDPKLYWPWMARFQLGSEGGRVRGPDKQLPTRLRDGIVQNYRQDPEGERGLYFLFSYLLACRAEQPSACPDDAVACRGRRPAGCPLCGVADHLAAEETRAWFRAMTDLPLAGRALSLSFTRYDTDSFIGPHNDVSKDPEYELTFLYYVNDPWHEDWGGELFFQRAGGPVQKITPLANRLVLFAPTADARHWVRPISPAAPRSRFAVAGWYLK